MQSPSVSTESHHWTATLLPRVLLVGALFLLAPAPGRAQEAETASDSVPPGFSLRGYGVANYFAFRWDTDPQRRSTMDLERVALYPAYRITGWARVQAELEFEHGGTGASMDFDKFEEAGEYETEIEKGGEVELEEAYVELTASPLLGIRIGRVKLPFGVAGVRDEPSEYFSTTRAESESALIPTGWYEDGVQLFGRFGSEHPLSYHLSLVNGLDSSGFGSSTWIVGGSQTRFEEVNASDLALSGRMDWNVVSAARVGVSGYWGNSTNNRPKPDLTVDAHVVVADVHAVVAQGPFRLRAVGLYGHLQNANLVSQANRNLPNQLNVKRTPVASEAIATGVEAGWNVLSVIRNGDEEAEERAEEERPSAEEGEEGELEDEMTPALYLFGRFDYYDTMAGVTGAVFDNPRWRRTAWTAGLSWRLLPEIVLKAQYSHRVLGLAEDNVENTLSTGIGFEF